MLKKHPFLNLIKITGLSLALGSILLILLYLRFELSYDRFPPRPGDIYRLTVTRDNFLGGKHFARIYGAGNIPDLAATFPGIESYVRLAPVRGGVMKYGEEYVRVSEGFEVDSTFFRVFGIPLLSGDERTILDAPGSMVVSESFARRVFGDLDPVGQVLTLPVGQFNGVETNFTVNGIMKDFPRNSHFHPEFVSTPVDRNDLSGWAWTYLLLGEGADPAVITSGYPDFYTTRFPEDTALSGLQAHLQPLEEIHLYSKKTREIEPNGNMAVIYSFAAAALLLLLISLINYTNLTLGMAGFSDRYQFVSRVFGASRRVQTRFFIAEGLVILVLTLVAGGLLFFLGLGQVRQRFALDLLDGNVGFALGLTALFSLLLLAAGTLVLLRQVRGPLSLAPSADAERVSRGGKISHGLIVVQNTIAIALIIAVVVIRRQTTFAIQSGIGSDNPGLVCLEDVHSEVQQRFSLFKDELLLYPAIASVSAMMEPPGGEANDMFRFSLEGYEPDPDDETASFIGVFPCDYSFASVFDLQFLAGQDFSENYEDNEGSGEYIINRSAMEKLGYADPEAITGKNFALYFGNDFIKLPAGTIIGVVEDFHLSSLKRAVDPLVLFKRKDLWLINFVVAFKPGMEAEGMRDLEQTWEKLFPNYPFQPEYVDSMIRKLYSFERLQASLLTLFTVIALFICSMGLLGLSLLTTQRRIREIGIRKVNGAGSLTILLMLNRDFLKWIVLSALTAIPLAWLAMDRWLESFAYRTALSWWIFTFAGLLALLIAALTVSIQSWRASRMNPVEALRYE